LQCITSPNKKRPRFSRVRGRREEKKFIIEECFVSPSKESNFLAFFCKHWHEKQRGKNTLAVRSHHARRAAAAGAADAAAAAAASAAGSAACFPCGGGGSDTPSSNSRHHMLTDALRAGGAPAAALSRSRLRLRVGACAGLDVTGLRL